MPEALFDIDAIRADFPATMQEVRGKPLIHRRFHFGFRVDTRDEVDAWLAEIRKAEAPITHGPEDYGDYYTFSCRDPDGYAIEIYFEQMPRGRAGDIMAEKD